MNLSFLRFGLITAALGLVSACTVMDLEPETQDGAFGQPNPHYPGSEVSKGHEGWVLVGYSILPSGLVTDVGVLESSGNEAFERETVNALVDWRFPPGDERHQTSLINFEISGMGVQLSRRFMSLNRRAHKHIESGDLEKAEEALAKIRSDDDLNVYDLAYSYIIEARIAGARGDYARQLELFRMAVINEGRWLDRRHYLSTLRAMIIMEIEQQDYVSAVRDFALLTETSVGKERGADLEDLVRSIDEQLQERGINAPPYMASNTSITVKRTLPSQREQIGERPSDSERGAYPPVKPATKRN